MMPRSVNASTCADRRSSSPISRTAVGSSIAEVVLDQLVAVALELDDLVGAEPEQCEVGIGAVLGQRRLERGVEPCGGAVGGGQHEEQLEGAVHERPAGHVDAGRLGQLLDAGEPERHRARRERLDPGGRQADRHVEHAPIVRTGV